MGLYAGVEAGGTKFVCVVGTGPHDIRRRTRFPTTTPEETLARVVAFLKEADEPLEAIGVGSFGPLDLNPASPTYGHITATPKSGWQNVDMVGYLRAHFDVPIAFESDVNAAAWGEHRWGAGRDVDTLVYITVGTGIGGGAIVNGRLVHGLVHPEMGHMRLPHDRERDPFPGICPFHGDCWEGLASGPAIAARWHADPATLPPDHPAWALEAHYLGLAIANIVCVLSPQRVILGGGVMHQAHLFPLVREGVRDTLAGYIAHPDVTEGLARFIVPPGLGDDAGVLGALALAMDIAHR